MSMKVQAGQANRSRPNWRKSESFNASEKYWLRHVGLWENRPMLDEETWWKLVVIEAGKVKSEDTYKFTSESLKKKFSEPPVTAPMPVAKKAALGGRK